MDSLVTITLLYCKDQRPFHARNVFASGGLLEDPATGAAAAATALAGMLPDEGDLTILQGVHMA